MGFKIAVASHGKLCNDGSELGQNPTAWMRKREAQTWEDCR